MDPTSVRPPDPANVTPTLDVSLASEEQLKTLLPYELGRYKLMELIGQGGMARVFRAVLQGPAGFEKTVAIKLLKASITHRSAGADFMQEAVYAGRLNHPNVVDVYELGEEQGCPYIAMEWVDGEPLHKILKPSNLLPPSVILDLLIALLNGLEQAHKGAPASERGGMLHRDIKPSNIIVSRYGVPKLVDFGIAAQLDQAAGLHWPTDGMAIGTVNWMSPEQLQGHPLDERSDLFSFGLVMASTVLCRNPLSKRYMFNLLQRNEPIPECLLSLEEETALDKHVPGLGKIVAQLMHRERHLRPRNARALRRMLQGLRPLVGHRPALPQWMRGALEDEADLTNDLTNETTWVMEGVGPMTQANTAAVPAGNIPTDEDLFVGRFEEFADLLKHLGAGQRLISLVGTGGAGKTRLSRRVANHFSEQFSGGAWFVDLSAVDSEDGIVRAVAQSMSIHLPADSQSPVEQLGAAIAKRGRLLIVLDNFEQLVSHAANTVGQWIAHAPKAQFLVTTREGLRLPNEVRVPLAPLSQEEAIELLQERAKLAGATWTDDEQTQQTLTQIVEALDRLPLAIELAAARANLLSPRELCERLEARFKLLRSETQGVTDRQATLHGLINWSWQRLEPWEQSTLAQLSVFRGGFSMEAAESIIDLSAWPDAPWTLDVIGALLDKSLIHSHVIDDRPRILMYVSIREFAAKRLNEENLPVTGTTVSAATRTRHASYFSGFSPIEATGSIRFVDPSVRRELHANFENLLSAARTGPQPHRTLCAVGALEVLMSQGPISQAVSLTKELLAGEDVPKLLSLRLHIVQAQCLRSMGRIKDAQNALSAAAKCAEESKVSPVSDALLDLNEVAAGLPSDDQLTLSFEIDRRLEESNLLRMEGRSVEARQVLEDALTLCSPTRTPTLQAKVQQALGWLLWTMSHIPEGIANLREARATYRVTGQIKNEATTLSSLAYVLFKTGKGASARTLFLECIDLLERSGDPTAPRQALSKLANLERAMGELDASLKYFDQSIALQDQVGDVMNGLINRIDRCSTLIVMKRFEEAESEILEVITASRQREATLLTGMATCTLGDVCIESGRVQEAIGHYQFAFDTFEGKLPVVEASVGMSLIIALVRAGNMDKVNELDHLTLAQEQYVEGMPRDQMWHRRNLAEVRLAQREPAAAYRHIGRAREIAQEIEGGGKPKILAELDELERKIVGKK